MRFEVLLSCMHEHDLSIIHRSNLDNVRTLVVNQCKIEHDYIIEKGIHRLYNTPTCGLSVSRNLAIQNAKADICLLSDNDEVFQTNVEEIVLSAYERIPEADVVVFSVNNVNKKLGNKTRKLKKYDLLRVSSQQISFKANSIKERICFDTKLGAGTDNGGGEENKFLLDCFAAGLNIYFVPLTIATLIPSESTWFKGYDEKFFFDRGKTTRYVLGKHLAILYAAYFLLAKHNKYCEDISFVLVSKAIVKGLMTDDVNVKYSKRVAEFEKDTDNNK